MGTKSKPTAVVSTYPSSAEFLSVTGGRSFDAMLREWVALLVKAEPNISSIRLFGSYAAGTPDYDSDVDLLVIIDGVVDPVADALRLRLALQSSPLPIDIVVMSADKFGVDVERANSVAREASDFGKEIFPVG